MLRRAADEAGRCNKSFIIIKIPLNLLFLIFWTYPETNMIKGIAYGLLLLAGATGITVEH